ncbi:MAG: class I SAM-dependent RNA methyltransferase [Planctomycetota bacterium]
MMAAVPTAALPLEIFVGCLPGLEPFLLREWQALGGGSGDARLRRGGISFAGDLTDVYRANLGLGVASHVLVRLAVLPARYLPRLRAQVEALPWRDWLGRGAAVAVRASCQKSRLYHSGAVAERVAQAIHRACGADVRVSRAAVQEGPAVLVRVERDAARVSLDTSGAPLHRRGWRFATGKAPLREDLARALLLASGWEPGTLLVDPMMGAGTLPIEAALLQSGRPPGGERAFAFEQLLPFAGADLAKVRDALAAREVPLVTAEPRIFGSDRDEGAVAAARANAARAGVADAMQFDVAPLAGAPVLGGALPAPAQGAVVSNPPFGRRVGRTDRLGPLYQSLGHLARRLPPTWRVALCAMDRRLALRTGLPLRTVFLSTHGGAKLRALACGVGDAADAAAAAADP